MTCLTALENFHKEVPLSWDTASNSFITIVSSVAEHFFPVLMVSHKKLKNHLLSFHRLSFRIRARTGDKLNELFVSVVHKIIRSNEHLLYHNVFLYNNFGRYSLVDSFGPTVLRFRV